MDEQDDDEAIKHIEEKLALWDRAMEGDTAAIIELGDLRGLYKETKSD